MPRWVAAEDLRETWRLSQVELLSVVTRREIVVGLGSCVVQGGALGGGGIGQVIPGVARGVVYLNVWPIGKSGASAQGRWGRRTRSRPRSLVSRWGTVLHGRSRFAPARYAVDTFGSAALVDRIYP